MSNKYVVLYLAFTVLMLLLFIIPGINIAQSKKKDNEPIHCRIIQMTKATATLDFHNNTVLDALVIRKQYVLIPLDVYNKMKIKIRK